MSDASERTSDLNQPVTAADAIDAREIPANEGGAEQRASTPELPECLRPGGQIDAALGNSRQAAMRRMSAQQLHEILTRELGALRQDWETSMIRFSERDPLLLLCLNAQEKTETAGELLAKAERYYQEKLADYDLCLGELIPQGFRDQVRWQLAHKAYRENANPTAAEDWQIFLQMQLRAIHEGRPGLPTGLPKLDEMLGGGLRGLTFLGGGKGVGKTALAISMVLAALEADRKCAALVYSLDMSKTRLYQRLLICSSGVDYRTLHDPKKSPETRQWLTEANQHLCQNVLPRLRVIERDFSSETAYKSDGTQEAVRKGLNCPDVMRDVNKLLDACDARQVLLVFDLFQKMDPHGVVAEGAATDHDRLDLLAQLQHEFSGPGRPYGFPILVISEIRKDSPKGNLTHDDMKGDGRMASDADVVMLMWPTEKGQGATGEIVPTTLRIDKGREGVQRGDLELWFEHPCLRFHDTEPTRSAGDFVSGTRPALDPLAE